MTTIEKKYTVRPGFTILEMVIAMVVTAIVISAIGVLTVDSQRSWQISYDRVYSDVSSDGYVAMKKFDATVRKASRGSILVDEAGNWLEVYYFADEDSTTVDRYALFYEEDGSLMVEYGQLSPRETLSVETLCENVSACTFQQAGVSIQMILSLDNGSQTNTVVSSAVAHN